MIADLFIGAAVAAVVSLGACRLLMAAGLWDAPYLARHQHTTPTPTGGGLGIAAGYAAGILTIVLWILLSWREWLQTPDAMRISIATAFACVFLLVGFFDDTKPLGPRLKFATFTVASVAAAWIIGAARVFPVTADLSWDVGFAAGLIGSALWIFTLVNCVNFMDGANGMAMGSAAVGFAGLGVVSIDAGAIDAAMMCICAIGALVGFLVWNFPHGRLFAGDSGALFVGSLAALTSLIAIDEGGVPPWIPPMLFFPLLADVLLTLAFRLRRRRNLMEGHAEHVYQVAIRANWSHGRTAVAYWAATALCGAVSVACYRAGGGWPLIGFAALSVASLLMSALVRGYAKKRGIAED